MYMLVGEFRVIWIFSTAPLTQISHNVIFSWYQNARRCISMSRVNWLVIDQKITVVYYFTTELNSYAPEPPQLTQPSVTWCGRPPQEIIMCSATFVHKTWPEKAPQPTTNYGHMMANSLILCRSNSYPKSKLILLTCFFFK